MTTRDRLAILSLLICIGAAVVGCAWQEDEHAPIVAPPGAVPEAAEITPSALIDAPPILDADADDGPPGFAQQSRPDVGGVPDDSFSAIDEGMLVPRAKSAADRFQIIERRVNLLGRIYEISLKIDQQTGETWRLDPATAAWNPILEPADSPVPRPPIANRYLLQSHKGASSNAAEAVFVRMDVQSGDTWLYTQTQGAWKSLSH